MTIALEINQLSKTYKSGVKALKTIDLQVVEGDFFALLGPNGAGKSTCIGIISSLINKSDGIVKIFGYDLDKDIALAKQQVGLVPQEFNFSQFEQVEHILITQAGYYGVPAVIAKQRAEKYLKQLDLWDKRKVAARLLSGGMKRRLMIARALMNEPRLLILDEPTAGVDIELRRGMWQFLLGLNKNGTTIILTTHYLEEAESLCRNIAIIDEGEIIENTSVKKLLSKLKMETFILDTLEDLHDDIELDDFSYKRCDVKSFEISIREGQTLNDLFFLLNKKNIQIKSMRNKSNRLEELFLSLVNDQKQSTNKRK